jgi:membrane protein implicated in regulation of membrane protease activity
LETFSVVRIVVSSLWFVAVFAGLAIPVFREGGGSAARSMKDRPAILIGVAEGLSVSVLGLMAWDNIMLSVSGSSGIALEVFGLLLGGALSGLLYYSTSAATVLNARLHPGSVRGFRLLGTRAIVSRPVGAELLGGWLLAPLVAALPLLTALLIRKPVFGGYDDSILLSRVPVLQSLLASGEQETVGVIAWAGVLIPLALRFFRKAKMQYALMGVFAFMTFVMLDSPFREYQPGNYVCALLNGLAMLWLYANFGMLGALSAHCSGFILWFAGALVVQPAASLQASGWGTLLAFGGIGVLSLVVASKGADVVEELYGESGVRIQARSRREEILAEFNVARSAQQQMLPSNPPAIAGYTISASCEPAREVGGDLYDFLRLSDGRWGIGVADVSGKGVPAALYMTLTKGLLCAASEDSSDPRLILSAVNKHLRTVTKRKMFVTMALGVLDPESGRVEYVRAGHNPVVWRRTAAGETRFLAGAGIGLGIAGPALFAKTLTTETVDLAPGDALIFYSDGLTEAMNETLEQFGEERLAAAVERADGMHATGTRDSILDEVRRFLDGGHSQDDLTIAVLRVNAA